MPFFAASEAPPRPESMKFPVNSLLAGNFGIFRDEFAADSPPPAGESGANLIFGGESHRWPSKALAPWNGSPNDLVARISNRAQSASAPVATFTLGESSSADFSRCTAATGLYRWQMPRRSQACAGGANRSCSLASSLCRAPVLRVFSSSAFCVLG